MANEDDHISDVGSTFDFKGFVLKVISYWQLILISVGISLAVAYYNNVRKLPFYSLGNSISIKDDQNPFFTSNTSLTFNWGGTSDKVNTAVTILRSRSHNEEVVERLQYYMDYLADGKYQRVDAYGATPFLVTVDTARAQAVNLPITITFKNAEIFSLEASIPASISTQNYDTKEKGRMTLESQNFSREYKVGDEIQLPFFSGVITRTEQDVQPGKAFYIQFLNFDSVVSRYKGISVSTENQNSSIVFTTLTNWSMSTGLQM